MTDTRVLDALMQTLERNPLVKERLKYPEKQFEVTDAKPFYAGREVVPTAQMNRKFAGIVERFHDDLTAERMERPRRGNCRACMTENSVHAVETKQNGALRVDGKCMTCGWELHRAGVIGEA